MEGKLTKSDIATGIIMMVFVSAIGYVVFLRASSVFDPGVPEDSQVIKVGETFSKYLFKGIIQARGPNTIVVEYDGTDYYYKSGDLVSLDVEVYQVFLDFYGEVFSVIKVD